MTTPGDASSDRAAADRDELLALLLADDGVGAVEVPPVVLVDRGVPVLASSAQRRLLFVDEFAPGAAVFNLPVVFRLRGPLDVLAMRGAVTDLVRRHEALRTNFEPVDGSYVQVIIEPDRAVVPFNVHDNVDLDPTGIETALREELSRPFDLRRDVKLRATLHRVAFDDHVLALTMHHIATDGWSIARLAAELTELYSASVEGRSPVLADLVLQYADWSVWQRRQEESSLPADQLAYWIEQLDGTLPVLDIPADHPRPTVQSYRSGAVRFELDEEVLATVRGAARAAGVTPFVFMLAAYVATLARWSGQDDFVVGTASANRALPEIHDVVGFFVNMVAIRAGVDVDRPFADLLADVKTSVRGAFAHESVPFDRIVEAVAPPRDLSRSIIFQTIFVLNNMAMPEVRLADLDVEFLDVSVGATEYDIACWVSEFGDRAHATVEFNTDVFDASTIERFVEHWCRLLGSAAVDVSTPVGQLSMLPPDERGLLVGEWANGPRLDLVGLPRLDRLVDRVAATNPDAIAVVCGDVSLTYGELLDRSRRLAWILVEAGVRPGDRVGVAVERSVEMVVSLLAVLETGAAYVPLDPEFPSDRLEFMVTDAELDVVIVSEGSLDSRLDTSGLQVIDVIVDAASIAAADPSPLDVDTSGLPGGGVAYVIYTSGSTGVPKGVEIEHASVVNFVRSMIDEPGMGADDVLLAVTTLSFDISVLEVFVPLAAGGRTVIATRDDVIDGRRLARLIESCGATVMQATPTTWSMLFESGWPGDRELTVLCGGEAMPVELGRRLVECCGVVWNMFGPTETTIWSTVQRLDERVLDAVNVPIGRPIANTVVRVLDDAGELAPVGVPGELFIGGAGVARGYLNRPELNEERFIADHLSSSPAARLYRTGDLARWLPDGTIEFLGRLDHQVKVRGHRIELGEIESALRRHPGVVDVVVVADGQASAGRLLAYPIFVDAEAAPSVGELRSWLRDRVPDYMVPSRFIPVESFPLTPSRKIDRARLPSADAFAGGTAEYVAPRTDVERIVAGIIGDTVGVERVGVDDDFFELGGHSLHATTVIAAIENALGSTIDLRTFFMSPTVAGASRALIAERDGVGSVEVLPVAVVDRSVPVVASRVQERLLFMHRFADGLVAYNLPLVLRLSGELDVNALRWSFAELLGRHESLRTDFESTGDGWIQVVVDASDVELPWVEETIVGGEAAVLQRVRVEVARPFDLRSGPKLRVLLVRAGDGDAWFLAVTMHHIAVDGWSIRRLLVELVELYTSRVDARAAVLPVLPVQYLDYSVWQREQLESDALTDGVDYWMSQLGGHLPVLDLPGDRPRPAVQSYRAGTVEAEIPGELFDVVRSAARVAGVTPFNFLMAGYVATLARWTRQDDFVVGTAAANRGRPELDNVVGMFVNTLALRTRVDAGAPFSELLGEVKQVVLGAFSHEAVPFDRIVEAINPPRDLSRSIVFQTMLVLNNLPVPEGLGLPGVEVDPVAVSTGSTEQDLSIAVVELADGALVRADFNTDVFDASTIERFVEHWCRLLGSAAVDVSTPVGQLSMLPPDERGLLVGEWANGPRLDLVGLPRLDRLVDRVAATNPDAIAVVCGDVSLTYGELLDRSRRLAWILVEAGVRPGDRVGVAVERSVEMVVSLLAVLETGAAYVPLDPEFPSDRLEFMVTDAELDVVIVSEGSLDSRLDTSGLQVIDVIVDAASIAAADPSPLDVDTSGLPGGGVAYVIYTSGSTGVPKGVEIEHASVVNFVRSMIDEPGMGADDVLLAVTTLSFDISVLEVFVPLAAGGRTVIATRDDVIDGRRLARLIESCGATVMQATPTTWSMLFESGWPGDRELTVLCGGEAMPVELGRRLVECCGVVWNMFGPTETTIWSTVQRLDERVLDAVNVPIGRPIANTVVRVLDDAGELAPVGVPGELFIGGAGVARGYLNRPELNEERFIADHLSSSPAARLYRTGDLARWLPDGTIEFLGRLDHQVKVRGHRIELGEIESALRRHPGVVDVVVVADGQASAGRLLAYPIFVDAEAAPSVGELRSWLRDRVPDYMVPSRFIPVESFPLTPSRKIDRARLPSADAFAGGTAEYVAPRTDVERIVAGIIGDTVGVERVGVDDDFFELGGHSLHATTVIAAIENALGSTIDLRTFFMSPTVAGASRALIAGAADTGRVERVAQLRVQLAEMSPEEIKEAFASRREPDENSSP